MIYVFRWQCAVPAATLIVRVEARNDRHAGELAAALLHDFVQGRARRARWDPLTPLIERGA